MDEGGADAKAGAENTAAEATAAAAASEAAAEAPRSEPTAVAAAEPPSAASPDESICCPICLESVEMPLVTECRHTFCASCLQDNIAFGSLATCPMCRAAIHPATIRCVQTGQPLRRVATDQLAIGRVFLQTGRPGIASYHFPGPSLDGAYISYENAPPNWRLSDGSPPPPRKPFENPRWDAASRTFRATVTWAPLTFGGDSRWEYTMVFDAALDFIVDGQVRCTAADGRPSRCSRFGGTLVYRAQRTDPWGVSYAPWPPGAATAHLDTLHFGIFDELGERHDDGGKEVAAASAADGASSDAASSASVPPVFVTLSASAPHALDNGTALPRRLYLDRCAFDAEQRRFTGELDVQGRFGTTLAGVARRRYELVWDADMELVDSGSITDTAPDGAEIVQRELSASSGPESALLAFLGLGRMHTLRIVYRLPNRRDEERQEEQEGDQ